jgi:hypothetical protein
MVFSRAGAGLSTGLRRDSKGATVDSTTCGKVTIIRKVDWIVNFFT